MSSAKDLARDIDCPAGLYHVARKGQVHDGPSRLCAKCCPGDGDRGVFVSPDINGDGALDRCGTNEPGMRFGAYPPVRPLVTPNPWPRVAEIEDAQELDWSQRFLAAMRNVVIGFALAGFVIVCVVQALRSCGMIK